MATAVDAAKNTCPISQFIEERQGVQLSRATGLYIWLHIGITGESPVDTGHRAG